MGESNINVLRSLFSVTKLKKTTKAHASLIPDSRHEFLVNRESLKRAEEKQD